jgi:hypothetical protein
MFTAKAVKRSDAAFVWPLVRVTFAAVKVMAVAAMTTR